MDLDGVRVLDLSGLLPGPYATQLLADAGADVVKVEPPGGDAARAMEPTTEAGVGRLFDAVNRGKRSVALDLKTDAGTRAFHDLTTEADAILEGFRPGVADRLGVGYDDVREHNGDIVYCSLSGYGKTGPYRDRVGHDLNYVGVAGLLDMTHRGDETPRIPGVPVADMAGGLFAAFAIVGGLLSRELGNGDDGTYFDISMTDVALSVSQSFAPAALAGEDPRPGETALTGGVPWYDLYETADGRYVTLAALEPRFWANFCRAVGHEEWIDLHGTDDPAEREALRESLSALFSERSREEWVRDLADAEAMVAGVNTPREAVEDPQFRARGAVVGGDGIDPRIGFPALVDGEDPSVRAGPPALGEHTGEILREVGYNDEALGELRDEGAI